MNKNELPEGFREHTKNTPQFNPAKFDNPQRNAVRFGRGRGPMGNAMPIEKPKETKKVLRRLIKYFKREATLILLLFAAVIFVTLCSLASPTIQGKAIDCIAAHKWGTMRTLIIMLAAVLISQIIGTLCQTLISAHISQRVVADMRHDLFEKTVKLSVSYIDSHSNGDIMSRMTNDIENISSAVSQGLGSLISGILTVSGTVVIMFIYCWQLTLITLVTVVLTVIVTKKLSTVMRSVFRRRSAVLGQLNGHSEEMITGFKSIAAYNRQQSVIAEFDRLSDELKKVGTRAEILGGCMGPVMNCISNISFVAVAAFGGLFALRGYITVGVISAFIIYAKQFSRPVNEIAQLYGSVQTAFAGAERIFEMLDSPDEDNSGRRTAEKLNGQISFCNVNFSYVPSHPVLQNFCLDIQPGQKIALVGSTGSGKTTVVSLLMRFYNPDSGEILIDGININDIARDELRKSIAIVLQDTVLFSDTIENNIKYSDSTATDDEMLRAARLSNCDYFINRLPEKYKTFLKQAGAGLSHGQRQLINIARAVMANPKILILDEATSSVDTRTEKHIQDAMVKLMHNRTSLIIAHRLSTIKDSDKIVVMDNGKITEVGTHDELLMLKGKYYALYTTQFAGNRI